MTLVPHSNVISTNLVHMRSIIVCVTSEFGWQVCALAAHKDGIATNSVDIR